MSNPFPELAPFDTASPRPLPPAPPPATLHATDDWLAREMRRDRDAEIKRTIVEAPPADQVAKATVASRQTGIAPMLLDGRLDQVLKAQSADALAAIANPAIGIHLATNPRTAIAAQDDAKSLGLLGRTWEFAKGVPGALNAGMNSAAANLSDLYRSIDEVILPITNPSGAREILDRYERERQEYQARDQAAMPQSDNFVVGGLLQGVRSIPQSASALAIGAATRSPNLAIAGMAAPVTASNYQEALRAGKPTATALRYGLEQGAIEAITEKIPTSSLVEAIVKRTPFGKSLVRQLGEEIPGEQLATVLQDFSEWATMHPDKPFSEYVAERPSAAMQTLLSTVSGTAGQTAAVTATSRLAQGAATLTGRVIDAQAAKREGRVITDTGKAATESKLRQRDPEGFNSLLRQVAEDKGATTVHIPGSAIQEYMQSDSYDPDGGYFSDYSDAISEAVATGGDVVLPVEFALGTLPGTPAFDALKDDMRLSAGGMSAREAATFEEAMADHLADLSERMDKADAEQAGQRTVIQKLTDNIALKLGDSYTAPAARTMAEVTATYLQTRAARLGVVLTGDEFSNVDIKQVLPEALAVAKSADATDLVINSLRKSKAGTTQNGPTLAEWIAARGGVNDTGGDLASMGLGDWHKQKAFRKRLLRDFDPTLALGGISGEGDYGIDSTLRSAIEAGYFPDLAGVEGETGPSALDTQALLDALSGELSGQPRYAADATVDHYRAAAEELKQLLEERGLDPDAMSDAELRSAIEALDEAGPEGGYEQPAYHGSPHIFDKFSLDAIGTGEGAQAYGYGLYFTSRKAIAEHYRDALSEPLLDGREMRDNEWAAYQSMIENDGSIDKAVAALEARIERETVAGRINILSGLPLELATLKAWQKSRPEFTKPGRVYRVEIPADDEFLLFDKPLDDQPEKVSAAITAIFEAAGYDAQGVTYRDRYGDTVEGLDEMTGRHFYDWLSETKAKDAPVVDEGNGWAVATPPRRADDKAASHTLHEAGIAGNKYLDGMSRKAGDGSYNYVVFDDSRVSIKAYEQEARARVQFDQGRVLIELFQSRNLSSYFHEFGHMALENLRADAEIDDAPEQLKADWQTVQDWFAANGHPVTDGIATDAHELWARGVEAYLMEGKAPSPALKRIFETIRSWMISIYKTIDRLRSPITPEIREVMDRLIATDEEIEAAKERQHLEALFKDAASVGMSQSEFGAYQDQILDARAEAHGRMVEKTMAAIRARETKKYREDRRGVRDEIEADVLARPIYKALANLKASPISEEWVKDNLGADALSLLPKRVPPMAKPGGAHPDAVAEMSGYSTGREMIEALIGADMAHRQAREGGDKRTMRERTVETETDAEMTRRYGDPLGDGTIEREALSAVHTEKQGDVIAAEIRVLARRTGRLPTPYALAREWARNRVRSGSYADEASPAAIQRHARNAAKAGRAAEQAMLDRDADEAFRQKQFQMLNNALVAEATAAQDDVQSAQKRLDKVARAVTMKSVDQDYLEQAQALLEQVELRERTQRSLDRQAGFAEWAAAREAEGYDVVVPASFGESLGTTHWTRLPVDQLLALDETVKQIMHLGRLKQTLLDGKEQREFDAIVSEALSGAGNIKGNPPKGLDDPTFGDGIRAGVAGWDAALLKMETVFDWLDGGNANGVFNRIAFRPIADAQAREAGMLKDYYAKIKALFEGVDVSRWHDRVAPPFIDPFTGKPASFQRQKIVAMALNIGNEGNLQRLADGYGWNAQAIEEYLISELTAEEWGFVQGVWDVIDTLWPDLSAMERRINGVAPDKVDARSFETPHGTMKGGYYPAIYDSALDMKTEERRGRETDLFEGSYTRASTRASATKERASKVRRPIHLDLGVINRHLGEVIHDITHREPVMAAHKFLTNARVASAVEEALGPEVRKMMRPWVKFVANSWAMERAGNEGFGKWLGKLRANATAVGLGLRATTMVTQIAGYSNSIEVVGETWITKGIAQFSAHPVDTYRFVMERSDEVRHRMDTLDRDLRTEIARVAANNPVTKGMAKLDDAKVFMFHGIGLMDRAVSIPTWIGAYNKALSEGSSEEDAAYAGDKAVRLSQGAGAPKDLAAIQRGTGKYGEALKLITMFYSYFSAMYQRQRTLARDVGGKDTRKPRNLPRAAARAFWLLVVPPLLVELLKVPLGAGGPDDDEWWAQWIMRKLLSNSLGGIPLARDVFEPTWNAARGGQFFNPQISPVNRALSSIVNVGKDVGRVARGEDTKHATKDVLEAAGYVTGLVPGQAASAAQFLVDVGSGDADPETFGDWLEGLASGKLED